MPSFLDIPLELRDQICEYVIFTPAREPPALCQSFEQIINDCDAYKQPKSRTESAIYRPQPITSNAGHLMLVNHQLNNEVIGTIRRIKNVTYDLDIIIADEVIPVVTWTHVPILTTRLEQLNTTFRIAGVYDKTKRTPGRFQRPFGAYSRFGFYTGWRGGDGGPAAIYWQLYSILERFVRVGPLGERERNDEHMHFTVKTLNINVETPPHVDPSRFEPPAIHRRRCKGSVLDPAYLTEFLEMLVRCILGVWKVYGDVLFEHVDEVVLLKDGEEWSRVDVAQRLKDGVGENDASRDDLNDLWRRRAERGLKVLE